MTTPEPLWQQMRRNEDEAFNTLEDIEEADRLSRRASILTVRDWLFPDGRPSQPWSMTEYDIWRRLTEQADLAIISDDEERDSQPPSDLDCQSPDEDYSNEVPTAEERSPSLR